MPGAHAPVGASNSKQWMNCPPSIRAGENIPEEPSPYAEEGTFAHEVAEFHLRSLIQKEPDYGERLKELSSNPLWSEELVEHAIAYARFVMERFEEAKKVSPDAELLIEQRLDFSGYVPEGFGTGDAAIISDGRCEIIDLKYGKGVPVEADGNSQMQLYALGAMAAYDTLYDIQVFRMTVFQPRIDNFSSADATAQELRNWGEVVVRPLAELAYKGEGEYKAGEHCRFCRVRHTCRARAEENLEMAKFDFMAAELLDPEEIAEILEKADALIKWAEDIKAYAFKEALNGFKWPGYKLVSGRSNRTITDQEKAVQVLVKAGFKEDALFNKKLKGLTDLEKAVGKKKFESLLADYLVKAPGKPVLVSAADKRPEINSLVGAIKDFSEDDEA